MSRASWAARRRRRASSRLARLSALSAYHLRSFLSWNWRSSSASRRARSCSSAPAISACWRSRTPMKAAPGSGPSDGRAAGGERRRVAQELLAAARTGGVLGEAGGALDGAERQARERLGRGRVEVVPVHQVVRHLGVAERPELHHLAARDDGRQHALETVGDEEEDDEGRRLLDALEQLVGRRRVQVLDLGDDPDAAGGREGLEAEVGDDRLDLVDTDEVALALEQVQVRVHAPAGALALRARAAVLAGRDERRAELARELRLGEALGAGQQVGVTERARADDAREERLGLLLAGDAGEHAAPLSRRAAGRRRRRPRARRPRRRRRRARRRGSRR